MNDIPEPDPGAYVLVGQHLYQISDEDSDGGPSYVIEMATDMIDTWDDLIESARKHDSSVFIMKRGKKLL